MSHQAESRTGGASTAAAIEGDEPTRSAGRLWMMRGLGVVIALVIYFTLGGSDLSNEARAVAAIAGLMAVWWMTEALPLSVTSLLPIVLLPMLPIALSILTLVVENSHGSKTPTGQIAKTLDSGKSISDVVSDEEVSIFGVALILSISWAATIGGPGTLLGTPPNAIVYATGNVKISEMVRGGIFLNIVGVILITMFTVLIGPFALGLVL